MVRRGAVATWRPATSQDGTSALVLAASGGHTDMVELLLDRGADVKAKDRVSAAAVCHSAPRAALGVTGGRVGR